MKTKNIFLSVLTIVLISLSISCQKNEDFENGKLSFEVIPSVLKNLGDDTISITSAVVTITDINGKEIYSNYKIELLNMNGYLIGNPLSLKVGSYKLTSFFLLDKDARIVYSTPIANSEKARLVRQPLAISFVIEKDKVNKLTPEVIDCRNGKPSDFGYASFSFEKVNTINFLIAVFIYNDTIKNFELTASEVTIKTIEKTLYQGQLSNITSSISVNHTSNIYILKVSKSGYKTKKIELNADSLLAFELKPLMIILEKLNLNDYLVAYYPFDNDIKDYSGNNNHGITNSIISFTPAKVNEGLTMFDTTETNGQFQFIDIPNTINTSEYTVSFWMSLNKITIHNTIMMLNDYNAWTKSSLMLFSANQKLTAVQSFQDLRTKTYGITFDYSDTYLNTPVIEINRNYFVAYRFANNTLNIYMDGIEVATFGNVNNVSESLNLIRIGVTPNPNGNYEHAYQYTGTIDELKIFNRALTNDELNSIYAEN